MTEQAAPISYTFRLTPSELSEGSQLSGQMFRLSVWQWLLTYALIFLSYALLFLGCAWLITQFYPALTVRTPGTAQKFFASLFLYGAVIFLTDTARRYLHRSYLAEVFARPEATEDRQMHLGPEGMRLTGSLVDQRFDWAAIHHVVQGKQVIAFGTFATVYILPVRAVGSAEGAAALRTRIDRWRQEAAQ